MDELAALVSSTAERTRHHSRADQSDIKQADAIRAALAGGIRVSEVMAVTGLSKARVYQIRDNRR